MFFSKDRSLYQLIFGIALPIAAQNLLTFSIGMADSVMVGFLGESYLAATSISNRFFFIMMIIQFGIAGGSNVLIAQYWGKKDVDAIRKVMAIMYRVVLALSSVFFILAQFIPEQIMRMYTNDPAVIAEGILYLKAVSWGFILFAMTNGTVMVLRAVRSVNIANLLYSVSLASSIFFNWVLIYGNLGAPALGIVGAGYATLISRIIEAIIMIVYLSRYEKQLMIRLYDLRTIDKTILKSFITNVTPVIANEGLWVSGSTVVSMIVGRLGANVVAAAGIEGMVWQLVTITLMGLQNATSVIVGNTIGAGEQAKLKEYTRTLLSMAYIIGPISGALMILLRPLAVSFYPNFDPATLELAKQIMFNSGIMLVFQSLNFVCLMGILRGGGDLRFVLIFDVIFLWTVSIPLGLAAAYLWQLPAPLVIVCLRSDEVLKAIVALRRVRGNEWIRDLTITA
ncbi:MAG: MATE family efflux transporter [Symbiobacteriaceae bacterium]|nr:MATE family efflux transporter [Symbiobacteriaceae bacterium]